MKHTEKLRWPDWEIQDCIGRGGFGAVYEITKEVFGNVERKALKIITIPKDSGEIEYMRCEGLDDESITNTLYSQVEDIFREYQLMTRLRENPNIVHCDEFDYVRHEHDLGWDIFMKMELLTPLMKALDKVKTEEEIIRLGAELCNALAACQKYNIIHRDIKPQNIFLSPEGNYKLGDFGIARTMEHTTKATVGIGTYSFMAPEVALGQNYGPTVDIYSLGLVLYWLLNERRGPFVPLPPATPSYAVNEQARLRRWSGEKIPAPRHGSEELKAVILKACAFNPNERYQTAREMMDALRSIGQSPAENERHTIPTSAPANQEQTVLALPEDKTVVKPIGYTVTAPPEEETVVEPIKYTVKESPPTVSDTPSEPPAPRKNNRWAMVLIAILAVLGVWAVVGRCKPKATGDWRHNVLMASPHNKFSGIEKDEIISVTFLNTLSNAPANAWDVSDDGSGSVLAWTEKSGGYYGKCYDLYIAGEGGINAEKATERLFSDYTSVRKIEFNNCFYTDEATNMERMFYNCGKMEELNLGSFDTSSVKNMSGMFWACYGLETLDLSGFNTEKVTDMESMFYGCHLISLNLGRWDTTNVTCMKFMFGMCSQLVSLDLSGWNTSKVKNMEYMFNGCSHLATLDLSGWDFSNVTNVEGMFGGCSQLTAQNLTGVSDDTKILLGILAGRTG